MNVIVIITYDDVDNAAATAAGDGIKPGDRAWSGSGSSWIVDSSWEKNDRNADGAGRSSLDARSS